MKKSDELRLRTRKMIAKNLIILVALAVVAFVGAFSWFKENPEADATGISATTRVADGLEYYIVQPSDTDQYDNINTKLSANAAYNAENENKEGFVAKNTAWHTGELTLDFTDPEFKFMEDLFLCEVTGDGKTFMTPKLLQFGEVAYVDADSDFEDTTANEEYMSFDIYFRSQSQHDIALLSDSSIIPKGEIDTSDESTWPSAAIGAVRFSVLNGSTRQLLWIPGPLVWYDGINDRLYTELTDFSGKGNVTSDGNSLSYTSEGTNDHAYYNASKTRTIESSNGTSIIASTGGDYTLGTDKSVVTLNQTKNDGYYYGHIRVNLWIEGEDAEARLKFVGGKFNMTLDFDFVESND